MIYTVTSFPRSAWERTPAMLRVALVAVALLALTLSSNASQPPAKKLPVPAKENIDRALALVNELFRDDLAQAGKDREARLKLAQTFLYEAKDTNDDPAGKFVLLGQSAQMAGQAGEGMLALQALDDLAASFDIARDAILALKLQSLQTASQAAATPDAHQGTLDAAKAIQDEAIAGDDFDSAVALGVIAEAAAKKLKSVALVSVIRKRNDEVKGLQDEYALIKPFVETLKTNPTDPKANLEAGKYKAFARGNFDKGLPLLAKGGDAALKELAGLDLSNPQDWQKMSQLGSSWAKVAATLKGESSVNALLRAYHWHRLAFVHPNIPEKERVAVQSAMLAVNNLLPADLRAGEVAVELRRFSGHNGPVFGVAISADGSRIASAGADGVVRLWDAKSGKELRRLEGHGSPVWAVCFSPDGKQVISGGFDKKIRVWDVVSGREIKDPYGHGDYVRAVAISANGRFVLSGGDDRSVDLWDREGKSDATPYQIPGLKQFPGHDHFVFGVAISRDGKRGLSASLDRTLRLWDLDTGTTLKVLTGHGDTVLGVTFTPDGQRALSASTDKTLRLWDLKTGQTIRTFKGHTGFVYSVAISPDGRRALSAGQDGKLIVWDVEEGKLLRTLTGHSGPVWSVAYSGDGRLAVSAGNDGTLRLWGTAK